MNKLSGLSGKRVVVTRSEHQADKMLDSLKAAGAFTIHLPVTKVVESGDASVIRKVIDEIDSFDWIVFSSANGVQQFLAKVHSCGAIEKLKSPKLAAVGPLTADALSKLLRAPDVVPAEFISEQVGAVLGEVKGKRILLASARQARKNLGLMLRELGAEVIELGHYDVVFNSDPNLVKVVEESDAPDFLTFASGSSVRAFAQLLANTSRNWLKEVPAVCIGPATAEVLRAHGVEPYKIAEVYTAEGIIAALLS